MKNNYCIWLLSMIIPVTSCNFFISSKSDQVPSFRQFAGHRYVEVKRQFANGVSISDEGFHLRPEWDLYFKSDDTVRIFHGKRKRFSSYRIFHSHKDLFHFARSWFRVRHLSADSMVLQPLVVRMRVVDEKESNVLMTFYSRDFIRCKLRTTVAKLRRPSRQDSLFVQYRIAQMQTGRVLRFAAHKPVELMSRSERLKVKKIEPAIDSLLREPDNGESYMFPRYVVHIDKAYRNFRYSVAINVGPSGKMTFEGVTVPVLPEFAEVKNRVAKGIVDVYLANLLEVRPGSTLGYPHSSTIHVKIVGRK